MSCDANENDIRRSAIAYLQLVTVHGFRVQGFRTQRFKAHRKSVCRDSGAQAGLNEPLIREFGMKKAYESNDLKILVHGS